MYGKGTVWVMSNYWAKQALRMFQTWRFTTHPQTYHHQQWWILLELWRCPITCIWLCSGVYCYAPFTGTTTGPIGYTPGVIAGVAVGCLSLSLLLTAATGVITFQEVHRRRIIIDCARVHACMHTCISINLFVCVDVSVWVFSCL